MSATDSEDSGAGGLSPINLIDCGLEDLVTALLHGQPIAMPEGGPPFDLENDTARCIFAYYARRRDLWPRAKAVQTHEIEDVLKALEGAPSGQKGDRDRGQRGKQVLDPTARRGAPLRWSAQALRAGR